MSFEGNISDIIPCYWPLFSEKIVSRSHIYSVESSFDTVSVLICLPVEKTESIKDIDCRIFALWESEFVVEILDGEFMDIVHETIGTDLQQDLDMEFWDRDLVFSEGRSAIRAFITHNYSLVSWSIAASHSLRKVTRAHWQISISSSNSSRVTWITLFLNFGSYISGLKMTKSSSSRVGMTIK